MPDEPDEPEVSEEPDGPCGPTPWKHIEPTPFVKAAVVPLTKARLDKFKNGPLAPVGIVDVSQS